ncbi:hypothetical protein [Streptomyces palmae]|uniref:Uncharacterized protein n=1 Tax=Streptomyces palmae TaxID=1701085 RepID=A0A4Z0HAK0_9ACTN|nr:hypothetical protein [Streptomyces palmae]TGB11567.1 hypothetical protein E4099_11980 [Streptomyces palmae]
MDMFPESAPQESEERLVREAMAEAAEGAPPLPDLVPVALAVGRARRARARAAIGGGMVGVVALGVFGAMLPSWGTASPVSARPTTGAPAPTSLHAGPRRAPVHIQPTPGESSMADLPAAERKRQEEFQQQAAAVLNELLPAAFGTVRPVDLAVSRYQGSSGDHVFPVVFSVRPTGGLAQEPPCQDVPAAKYQCERVNLMDGMTAHAITSTGISKGGKEVVGVSVSFVFKDSTVVLSADGDDSAAVSAPVTADQLLRVARDERFLRLVRYAEASPMEPRQESAHGG